MKVVTSSDQQPKATTIQITAIVICRASFPWLRLYQLKLRNSCKRTFAPMFGADFSLDINLYRCVDPDQRGTLLPKLTSGAKLTGTSSRGEGNRTPNRWFWRP